MESAGEDGGGGGESEGGEDQVILEDVEEENSGGAGGGGAAGAAVGGEPALGFGNPETSESWLHFTLLGLHFDLFSILEICVFVHAPTLLLFSRNENNGIPLGFGPERKNGEEQDWRPCNQV